jgi:SAM-dependent methyltransferase
VSTQPTSPDADLENLDYVVEWRPWLWRRPVADALEFLGDLRGKRVLEIGGRRARVTCLLARRGASVTMLDTHIPPEAHDEVRKWGVADCVRLVETTGGFDEVAGQRFDVVFTKSVLWSIEPLGPFLDAIDAHLAEGGKVAFVENYRGGRFLLAMRQVVHLGKFDYAQVYHGIRPDQLPLFRERFADVSARRHLYFVYTILRHKRQAG